MQWGFSIKKQSSCIRERGYKFMCMQYYRYCVQWGCNFYAAGLQSNEAGLLFEATGLPFKAAGLPFKAAGLPF